MREYIESYLTDLRSISFMLDLSAIERIIEILAWTKKNGGRLFILGIGGSGANSSHACNDFRKLCGIEAYSPCDNFAEFSARANDNGWQSTFVGWLKVSRLSEKDTVLVLSVSGGRPGVSQNISAALDYAHACKSTIIGIVGRDGGDTAKIAHACVIIPTINTEHITPHAESFQVILFHLIVNHPSLRQ